MHVTEESPRPRLAPMMVAATTSLVTTLVHGSVQRHDYDWMVDANVYLAAGRAVATGQSLYAGPLPGADLPFQYPPFGAMVFAPFAELPVDIAGMGLNALGLLCLQMVVWWCLGRVGITGRRRVVATVGAAPLSLLLEPVQVNLLVGQVNLVLMVAAFWDVTRRPGARGAGVFLGLATGVKLIPGVFVVYLLLTRRYRTAAVATGTFGVTVLLGLLPGSTQAWSYWTTLTGSPKDEPPELVYSHSLWSVLVRATHGEAAARVPWLLLAGVVGLLGVAVAVRLGRTSLPGGHRDLLGLTAVAMTTHLVMPIAWEHYWVWIVPMVVLLLPVARTRPVTSSIALVLLIVTFGCLRFIEWGVDPFGDALALTPLQVAQTSVYAGTTVLLLVVVARIALTHHRTPTQCARAGTAESHV